jgi:16S rRNA (adenine1518-N6/adenine1519-N6)-dimethyltransferase
MSVLVGSAYRVETLFHLRPGSFRPRPKVVSTVSRWRPNPEFGLGEDGLAALRACLAASFAHRRRTIHNNLRTVLPGGDADSRRLLRAARLEGSLRPGAIPPDGFLRMAAIWPETTISAPGGEEL